MTGDDTAIACCVSAMPVGKQMQFFGARVNLAKTLLYAINGGRDEMSGIQVAPPSLPVTGEYLDYNDVTAKLDAEMDWLARVYVDALNVIHYMHDKYAYERLEMALHDYPVRRTMATGIAGLAVVAAEGDPEIGYYHSYEITGSVNGPGIRFTLYLSGCPLRCQYCQNPDMWTLHNGRRVTVGRMLDEVAKYAAFVKTAHGGITVSGGEPMLQIRFLQALLRRCKQDLGLHTAVDTSGFLGARASEDFLDLVDPFLLDIKAGDEQLHHLVTSAELAPTLRFARRLSDRGNPMWVRYVLVPGLTDAADDVEKVARFTSTLAHVERVEVLPFHQLGAGKWADLRLPYQLADVPPASPELVRRSRTSSGHMR